MKNKEKIIAEYCPRCKDEKMVRVDGEIEVFECKKCKFRIKKK